MIREVLTVTLSILIDPQKLVFWMDLLWINALFSKWYLILFVVMNRGHLLDDANEYWNSIFRQMNSCKPRTSQLKLCEQISNTNFSSPAKSKFFLTSGSMNTAAQPALPSWEGKATP